MEHSDGTGIIDAAVIENVLKQTQFQSDASIIQIRYGGAKGTLTSWNTAELIETGKISCVKGADILLRPSMIKFNAKYEFLEICRVGTRVPYYLNRNVIFLLNAHGIASNVFLNLQRAMIKDLDEMMYDPCVAQRVVQDLSGPEQAQRSCLVKMLQAGLSPSSDPFLFRVC